jgi:hypothetical protein
MKKLLTLALTTLTTLSLLNAGGETTKTNNKKRVTFDNTTRKTTGTIGGFIVSTEKISSFQEKRRVNPRKYTSFCLTPISPRSMIALSGADTLLKKCTLVPIDVHILAALYEKKEAKIDRLYQDLSHNRKPEEKDCFERVKKARNETAAHALNEDAANALIALTLNEEATPTNLTPQASYEIPAGMTKEFYDLFHCDEEKIDIVAYDENYLAKIEAPGYQETVQAAEKAEKSAVIGIIRKDFYNRAAVMLTPYFSKDVASATTPAQ